MEKETQTNWFYNTSQIILLLMAFLLPIFFIPTGFLSFQFSKVLLVTAGVLLALILFLVSLLKKGVISIPRQWLSLSVIAVPVVFLVSALAASPKWLSVFGYGFEIGTASFMILMFLLFILSVLLFQSYSKVHYLYLIFFTSFSILAILHILRLIAGPQNILGSYLPNPLSNTIGNWNGLAIFFGIATVLSTLTLDMLRGIPGRVKKAIYTILVVSIILVAIINFQILLYVLAVVMLGYGLYHYFNKGQTLVSHSFIVGIIALILVIPIIPGTNGFTSVGSYIGTYASQQFGVGNVEVRPSWNATYDVMKASLKSSPFVGSGPNTFSYEWNLHKPVEVNQTNFWNADFNYGVGFLPTTFITTGVLGILAWLSFLAYLLYLGLKSFYYRFESPFARYITLSSFIVSAYLWVFMVTYTPAVVIIALTFLFSGLFVSCAYRYNIVSSKSVEIFGNKKTAPVYVVLIIIVILASIWFGAEIGRRAVSSVYFQRASFELNANSNISGAQELVISAINISENDFYYRGLSELQLIQFTNIANQNTDLEELSQQRLQGFFDGALISAQRARALNPKNYVNHVSLGRVFTQALGAQGALDGAVNAYMGALSVNPNNPGIHLDLARIEFAGGNTEKALENIDKALELKSNYTDAVFLEAQIAVQEGEVDQAIETIESALLNNSNPVLYFQLGVLKYNEDNFSGAREAFQNALLLNRNYANARYFLGLSEYELGNTENAIAEFRLLRDNFAENQEVSFILENLEAGNSPFEGAEPPVDEAPEDREELPVDEEENEETSEDSEVLTE